MQRNTMSRQFFLRKILFIFPDFFLIFPKCFLEYRKFILEKSELDLSHVPRTKPCASHLLKLPNSYFYWLWKILNFVVCLFVRKRKWRVDIEMLIPNNTQECAREKIHESWQQVRLRSGVCLDSQKKRIRCVMSEYSNKTVEDIATHKTTERELGIFGFLDSDCDWENVSEQAHVEYV